MANFYTINGMVACRHCAEFRLEMGIEPYPLVADEVSLEDEQQCHICSTKFRRAPYRNGPVWIPEFTGEEAR